MGILNWVRNSLQFKHSGMSIYRRRSTFSLIICAFISSTCCRASAANVSDSGQQQTPGTKVNTGASRDGKTLKGAVRSEASLNSSLKLIPDASYNKLPALGAASKPTSPTGTKVDQFAGSSHVAGANPAVVPLHPAAKPAPPQAVTPPGSHFTLTPKNGVMSWAPGYAVVPISVKVTPVSSLNGVKPKVPGQDVSKVTGALKHQDPKFVTRSGVTAYLPDYQVTVSTPKVGLASADSRAKATVTTRLFANAHAGKLLSSSTISQIRPLKATELLLPEYRSNGENARLTWDKWYQRFATIVYSGWQNADVGPGLANVRVTVTKSRDLSCQITDFTPAPDVVRDIGKETAFREAAVRAVNLVSRFEIPEFPQGSDLKKITFDVELKRTIDGSTPFSSASAHGI